MITFQVPLEQIVVFFFSNCFIFDIFYQFNYVFIDLRGLKRITFVYNLRNFSRSDFFSEFLSRNLDNTFFLEIICEFIYQSSKFFYIIAKFYIFSLIFICLFYFLVDSYKTEEKKNLFYKKFCNYIIIWVRFLFEKLENNEESYLTIKLVSFFLFLFFSNFLAIDSNINFIVFIEWNLPVCFGIILICELVYFFGSYILLYLNGSKSRKVLIVSFFEDLMNFFILLIRISLQLIRGIICGIYHDLLREANIKIIQWLVELNWNWVLKYNTDYPFTSTPLFYLILFYIFFLYIITFAIILMFLQALFLFLAIWLFCKCWFLSVLYSKFFITNKKNILKYKKYLM